MFDFIIYIIHLSLAGYNSHVLNSEDKIYLTCLANDTSVLSEITSRSEFGLS